MIVWKLDGTMLYDRIKLNLLIYALSRQALMTELE